MQEIPSLNLHVTFGIYDLWKCQTWHHQIQRLTSKLKFFKIMQYVEQSFQEQEWTK